MSNKIIDRLEPTRFSDYILSIAPERFSATWFMCVIQFVVITSLIIFIICKAVTQ